MNRDFKGVWVPREIYLADNLSWSEKFLLIEIDSLDSDPKKGCYASARYLADFLGMKEGSVKNMILNLKQKGYVTELWSDGHSRGLRSTLAVTNRNKTVTVNRHKKMTQPSQKNDAEPSQKNDHSNTKRVIQEKEEEKSKNAHAQPPGPDQEMLSIYQNVFPLNSLTIPQMDLITIRITDGVAWRRALMFWAGNDYRPQSILKICDYYDEILKGKHGNGKRHKQSNSEITAEWAELGRSLKHA